jgi:hypothetical protein
MKLSQPRYRFRTPAFVGRWCGNLQECLQSSVQAGQAVERDHGIELFPFVQIGRSNGLRLRTAATSAGCRPPSSYCIIF